MNIKLIPIFSAFEADMDSLSPFGKTGNLNQLKMDLDFFRPTSKQCEGHWILRMNENVQEKKCWEIVKTWL